MTNTSESQRRFDTANGGNPEVTTQPTFPWLSLVSLPNPSKWHFDIDRYLNKIVPRPPWRHIPYPVAHFMGYRKDKIPDIGNIAMIFWAAIGIFCSIILIELASRRIPALEQNGTLIVASFGAAAILEFYAIESPLAQPRNMVLSQLIASSVGVSVSKLFALSPHYDSIRWLGGGIACAAATVVMALTKTIHPPAGATALLAVVDHTAVGIGWQLIPAMMLGCAVMLATALLVNNIQRRFPSYWWTPERLHSNSPNILEAKPDLERGQGSTSEDEGLSSPHIVIKKGVVIMPPHIFLSPEEKVFLETLSNRI